MASKDGSRDKRVDQVRDALFSARTRTVRSTLYHFMRQNHDELSTVFEEAPPAWGPLADRFGTMGLTDRGGKPPSANTARMTWYRARLDVRQARSRQGSSTASESALAARSVNGRSPVASRPVVHMATDDAVDDRAPEPEFRMARPHGSVPSLTTTPKHPTPVQRRDPDAAIAELLRRPRAGSIPMPDVPEPEED